MAEKKDPADDGSREGDGKQGREGAANSLTAKAAAAAKARWGEKVGEGVR